MDEEARRRAHREQVARQFNEMTGGISSPEEPIQNETPEIEGSSLPMEADLRWQIITAQIQNLREQIEQARRSADTAGDRRFRSLAVQNGVSLSRELRQWLVYLDAQDAKKAAKEAAENAPLPPVRPGDTPPQLQAADPLRRPSPMADDEMTLDDVTPFIEPVDPPPAKPAEEPAPATPDAPVEASANTSRQRRRTASHV